jgi:dTDP-4-amino-4,6-dideoxygalactose transaminase
VFGVPADVKKLQALARKHNVKLIFDAAHAFGAKVGKTRVGNFGDAEVFSCSPIKLLTTAEGGIVATNNKKLADFVRLGRNYGDDGTNNTLFVGLSARMSEFHAAIGLRSLAKLDSNLSNRLSRARSLMSRITKVEPGVQFQTIPSGTTTTYYILSAYIDPHRVGFTRDQVHDFFAKRGISTRKYFFPPLHKQTAYKHLAKKTKPLPITDDVAARVLSLPLYSHLAKKDLDRIVSTFEEFVNSRTRRR